MRNHFRFVKLCAFAFFVFAMSQPLWSQSWLNYNSCGLLSGVVDYYETEVCGEHTNWAFDYPVNIFTDSIYVEYNNSEHLPFPAAGNMLRVRGTTSHRYFGFPSTSLFDYFNFEDVDGYSFFVNETTTIRVVLQRPDANKSLEIIIRQLPEYVVTNGDGKWSAFDFMTSYFAYSISTPANCIQDVNQINTFTLQPGTYWFEVRNRNYQEPYFGNHDAWASEGYGDPIDAAYLQAACVNGLWDYGIIIENLNPSTLPCTGASPITVGPTFADFEITGSTEAFASNSPAQCLGPGSRPEKWYKFVPVTSNSYVRAWGNGDFDAAVEVYDGCSGNLIKCQNEVGPGDREIVILPGLNIGQTYYYRVYHVGTGLPSNNTYLTSSAHIPFVWLTPSMCNSNVINGQWITSTQPVTTFLLNARMWRFTETTPPYNSYEYIVNGTANRINWNTFTQKQLGKSYTVEVKTRQYQGPHWGEYTNPCVVHYLSAGIMQFDQDPEAADVESWFSIYPNPSNGNEMNVSFNLGNGSDQLNTLNVYDLAGRLVHSMQLQGADAGGFTQVSFEGMLSDGVYIARINSADGTQLTEKFMVKN